MSDQDDDKKILNEDSTDSKSDDQPSVVENNQPESVDSSNDELSDSQNVNEEQNDDKKEVLEASNENPPDSVAPLKELRLIIKYITLWFRLFFSSIICSLKQVK